MLFHSRRLDDDIAFITGASAGIGRAIAESLVELGARVVLGARRLDRLQAVAESLNQSAGRAAAVAFSLDVNDAASVDAWLQAGTAAVGAPSILINNAGLAKGRAHVKDLDGHDADAMLRTNFDSVVHLTRKVVPGLVSRGRGDVVFIASIAGTDPYAGGAVYCATKAGLQAFARALRHEMNGSDVRVLSVDPGLVQTEFSVVRTGGDVEAAAAVYRGVRALEASDVADAVAFALSRPRRLTVDNVVLTSADQFGTRDVRRTP